METISALNQIIDYNAQFPETAPLKRWKEGGGKIVGWICNYVPEEVLLAAGLLSVRVIGYKEVMPLQEATGAVYRTICSPMRSCLQVALDGHYDYLDGLVYGFICDASRHIVQIWGERFPIFTYEFYVPRQFTPKSLMFYRDGVSNMKKALEENFGKSADFSRLWDAVQLMNSTRKLLREVYEIRQADSPPITGAETLEITNAAVRMPKEQINELLVSLLAELRQASRKPYGDKKLPRIALMGSMLNNPDFIAFVERQGCQVVVDFLCTGFRYCHDVIDEAVLDGVRDEGSLLRIICERYLNGGLPCPQFFPLQENFERVKAVLRDFRVEGVVMQTIQYCSPYGWYRPFLLRQLEILGIPAVSLDIEYGTGESGQLKTRIQAFLETIETAKAAATSAKPGGRL